MKMETAPSDKPDLTDRVILVIDDDERSVFAVQSYLERDGMEVLTADSAQSGLEQLRERQDIDAVLMDIKMPGMDGYEAMRAIRSELGREDLPVIAVTGKVSEEEAQRCVEAGASDYLTKPLDVDRLTELLGTYLGS